MDATLSDVFDVKDISVKYGLRVGGWDNPADIDSITMAIKELLDNCFMKAEEGLSRTVTPWNGTRAAIHLETITTADGDDVTLLNVVDNGRGVDKQEFVAGFNDRSHDLPPQQLQTASISQFGTGSKDADAYLSTDVYYFSMPNPIKNKDYLVIGRAGKDPSIALDKGCLWVQHMLVPKTIKEAAKDPNSDCGSLFLKLLVDMNIADLNLPRQQMAELTGDKGKSIFYTREDRHGLSKALRTVNSKMMGDSGFMRVLKLRPGPASTLVHGPMEADHVVSTCRPPVKQVGNKVQERVMQNQLHYTSADVGSDGAAFPIASLLEQNYLFPPANDSKPPSKLVAEQIKIVQELQANPDYYKHPMTNEVYTPKLSVQKLPVNWGQNTLLANLHHGHSGVMALKANTDRYGDSKGEAPAKLIVTYLGKSSEERKANIRLSGVSVYVGCRRVCDPELKDGNWSLGGMARSYMDIMKTPSSFSPLHQTHRKGTWKVMGKELFNELDALKYTEVQQQQQSEAAGQVARAGNADKVRQVYGSSKAQILFLKGAHVTIVVRPGQLTLDTKKQGFIQGKTAYAHNLMVDAVRMAIKWIAYNPPEGDSTTNASFGRRLSASNISLRAALHLSLRERHDGLIGQAGKVQQDVGKGSKKDDIREADDQDQEKEDTEIDELVQAAVRAAQAPAARAPAKAPTKHNHHDDDDEEEEEEEDEWEWEGEKDSGGDGDDDVDKDKEEEESDSDRDDDGDDDSDSDDDSDDDSEDDGDDGRHPRSGVKTLGPVRIPAGTSASCGKTKPGGDGGGVLAKGGIVNVQPKQEQHPFGVVRPATPVAAPPTARRPQASPLLPKAKAAVGAKNHKVKAEASTHKQMEVIDLVHDQQPEPAAPAAAAGGGGGVPASAGVSSRKRAITGEGPADNESGDEEVAVERRAPPRKKPREPASLSVVLERYQKKMESTNTPEGKAAVFNAMMKNVYQQALKRPVPIKATAPAWLLGANEQQQQGGQHKQGQQQKQ